MYDVAATELKGFAQGIASQLCNSKAALRRDVLYGAFELDDLHLIRGPESAFGPAFRVCGRYGDVRVEVMIVDGIPHDREAIKGWSGYHMETFTSCRRSGLRRIMVRIIYGW